jgi:hypothetical protein
MASKLANDTDDFSKRQSTGLSRGIIRNSLPEWFPARSRRCFNFSW